MSFAHPAAFALFALAAILIFLAFLRALTRPQPVSSVALWSGLTQSPERQRPKLHRWAEPILFAQLLALAAMVFAVTQPARRSQESALRGLAIVVDETASMRTTIEPGVTRFARAVERARELLAESPASRVTLLQFSSRSHVVVPPTDDVAAVERALARLEPSWRGDGNTSDLLNLLTATGGTESYDRLVLLSDRAWSDLPPGMTAERIGGGHNVGLIAFTVRENPSGPGVSAFLEVRNETATDVAPRVTIRDEASAVTVTLPVGAETSERFVSPFPASRGVRFTATLAIDDDFAADNVRFFSLDRPSTLRVRWIGEENAYLRAALDSSLQTELARASEPADLTVVVGRTLDQLPPGDLLLVASDVPSLYRFAGTTLLPGGDARAEDPAHPLLAGVDPAGIYVESLPETFFFAPVERILTANGLPFLSAIEDGGRTLYVFSTDLRATNLPITVEFPVLVRNVLASVTRIPGALVHTWRTVGELLEVAEAGGLRRVRDPDGREIALEPGQTAFLPERPGLYDVETDRGTQALAVNVPTEESSSALPDVASAAAPAASVAPVDVLRRLWPLFAWIALLLLAVEAGLYVRFDATRRLA